VKEPVLLRGTSQTAETTRTQLAQHRILEDKDAHTEEASLAEIELPENINEYAQTFAQTETGVVVELAAGGCGIASILKVVAKARQLNTFREIEIKVSAVSFFDLCDGTVRQGRSKHTLSAFHIHLCYESTHSGDWSLPKMSKTQWRSLPNRVQRIGWHLRGRYSGSIRSCSHGSRAARKQVPWLSHNTRRDFPANLRTSDRLQGINTKQTALALGLAKRPTAYVLAKVSPHLSIGASVMIWTPDTSSRTGTVSLGVPERTSDARILVVAEVGHIIKDAALAFTDNLAGKLGAWDFSCSCRVAVVELFIPRASLQLEQALCSVSVFT
jgi:hypothetical protein